MSSDDSTPSTSLPSSPLSTAITPPTMSATQLASHPPQIPLTPLPSSIAITPLPGSAAISPLPSTMPLLTPSRGIPHTTSTTTSSHLKESLSASDMLPTPKDALEVTTMPEVREAIDKLDQEIVTLLGTRLRFIEAAARIKTDKGTVRDEWRKRDVIEKASRKAMDVGFDKGILERVYEALVEGCIEYEGVKWDEMRRKPVEGK